MDEWLIFQIPSRVADDGYTNLPHVLGGGKAGHAFNDFSRLDDKPPEDYKNPYDKEPKRIDSKTSFYKREKECDVIRDKLRNT